MRKILNELSPAEMLALNDAVEALNQNENWKAVLSILEAERERILRGGLYDFDTPRELYAGQLLAFDVLLDLPGTVLRNAQEIRAEKARREELAGQALAVTRRSPGGEVSL